MKFNYARSHALLLGLTLNLWAASGPAISLLSCGDDAVLTAPVANFRTELQRIPLSPQPFLAVADSDPAEHSIGIELQDLHAALIAAGRSSNDTMNIVSNHLAARTQLREFELALERSHEPGEWMQDANGDGYRAEPPPAPDFPKLEPVPGLPAEFADYFEGTLAWKNPALTDKAARRAWERILERPPGERRFKSTWAAFMLGRAWETEDPRRAILSYQQVRTLAAAGFADPLGLAAASFGQEARVQLRQNNYERAIDLYLDQSATGDPGAYLSLCFVMRALARSDGAAFPSIAKNPRASRVVTAYLISTKALQLSVEYDADPNAAASNHFTSIVGQWLAAAGESPAIDSSLAEELALAAYQNDQWPLAQQWSRRAGATPTTQWLQAKLLFRAGRADEAAALLARIEHEFPIASDAPDAHRTTGLHSLLSVSFPDLTDLDAATQIRGELGVYQVARGRYLLALDDFLRAGLWMDAAYVAERVLTVDELKTYVDRCAKISNNEPPPSSWSGETDSSSEVSSALHFRLRYLLARRLTRNARGIEAREYYPEQFQPDFDTLVRALTIGEDESRVVEERAPMLFLAAGIARTNGMELLGTELGPDWHLYDGDAEDTFCAEVRTHGNFTLFPASSEELRRAATHGPQPEMRFHYRYQAALLGWEAAKLMPDNDDETARVLCVSGSWLKNRDPQIADIFYKSLVRRCRRTDIGDEADRIRWFPLLDDEGNVIPRRPREASEEAMTPDDPDASAATEETPGEESDEAPADVGAEFPVPGEVYIIHAGDSLSAIARAASVWGRPVTVESLRETNPGLEPQRLPIGGKILIPDPDAAPADDQ